MEPAEEEEAKDDDKSIAVFLEWCEGLGYETLERFRDADEDDIDSIPLSPEQVGRVLSLLQESTPAAWHPSSCKPAVRDPPLGAATAPADHSAGGEGAGTSMPCSEQISPPVAASPAYFAEKEALYEKAADTLEFICPISHDVMQDPVVAADGHTYERRLIEMHFERHGLVSPMHNGVLETALLFSNTVLRNQIEHALEPVNGMQATPTVEAVVPAAEIEMAVVSPLLLWLREHRFAEYTAALDELGVETLDDLIDVTVGDLTAEAVSMKPIQARRFVRLATERLGMGAR
jgi:hypothetical protein